MDLGSLYRAVGDVDTIGGRAVLVGSMAFMPAATFPVSSE